MRSIRAKRPFRSDGICLCMMIVLSDGSGESSSAGALVNAWSSYRNGGRNQGRGSGQGAVGTQKWAIHTGGSIFSTAAIGPDGTSYIGSGDNNFYSFLDSLCPSVVKLFASKSV